MAGLFSIIKVYSDQEVLTNTDVNNEFANIKNNFISSAVEGYSTFNNVFSLTRAQATIDPAPGGDPSQASDNQSVAGEIQKLRYALGRLLGSGSSNWYSSPVSDLTVLSSSLQGLSGIAYNSVNSGAVSSNGLPMSLIPSGSTNSVTLKASTTPVVVSINATNYTFSSDITLTGLTLAPSSNNTAILDNDSMAVAIAAKKTVGESFTHMLDVHAIQYQEYIPLTTVGSGISSVTGKQIAFKLNGEYSIGTPQSSGTQMWSCLRGYFFNSSGAALPRVNCSTGDTLTLMQLTYVFLRSNGTLNATYNTPSISDTAPSSPSIGDYWYDNQNHQWKIYSGSAFTADNSVYVGLCVQDSTKTVAARSADFFGSYSSMNTAVLQRDVDQSNIVRSTGKGTRVSVYGLPVYLEGSQIKWNITTDLESGVSLSANKTMFLYLNKYGKPIVSDIAPHSREDLQGYYHPSAPWRCLGSCVTDGTNFNYLLKNFSTYPLSGPRSIYYGAASIGSASTTGDFGLTYKFVSRGRPFVLSIHNPFSTTLGPFTIGTSGSGGGSIDLGLRINTTLFSHILVINVGAFGATATNTLSLPFAPLTIDDQFLQSLVANFSLVSGEISLVFNLGAFGGTANLLQLGILRITEL